MTRPRAVSMETTMAQSGSEQDESQSRIEPGSQDLDAIDSSRSSYWTWLRADVLKLVRNKWFDRTVLVLIGANTVILINNDYREGAEKWWPAVTAYTLHFFAFFFFCEMLLKWLALGLVTRPHGYFRDAWNILDFVVVVSDMFTLLIHADLSALRSFRVLRPLRSLNRLRGMRVLVGTVLLSISKLANAAILGAFLLVLFAILGLNLWGGLMHRRCRLTNAPIEFVPHGSSCSPGRSSAYCVSAPAPAGTLPVDDADYFLYTAWCNDNCRASLGQNLSYYHWVIDDTQERLCGGHYTCALLMTKIDDIAIKHAVARGITTVFNDSDTSEVAPAVVTTCGSALPYDEPYGIYGEKVRTQHAMVTPGTKNKAMLQVSDDVRISALNFGFTRFDNMAEAFITVFQCITLEGWTNIMYMVQDASGDLLGVVYFFMLVVAGSFFLLNFVLAIVWEAFISYSRPHSNNVCGTAVARNDDNAVPSGALQGEDGGAEQNIAEPPRIAESKLPQWAQSELWSKIRYRGRKVRNCCRRIVNSSVFEVFILLVIVANIITMSMNTFPPHSKKVRDFISVANNFFSSVFIVECILLHIALTPYVYWTKMETAVDGILTISSIVELCVPREATGAPTTLRSFRLLRAFKLARAWSSFRMLLQSIVYAMLSLGNFTFLLLMVIVVFALLGQYFFALQFTFDDNGMLLARCQGEKFRTDEVCSKELCPIKYGLIPSCVPRGHFDTFLWAFVTVFQILSLENWNDVLYNAMQARGAVAVFYFMFVIVVGSFIILNLFIAIIMTSFDEQSAKIRRRAVQRRQDKLLRNQINEQLAMGNFFLPKSKFPWRMSNWRHLVLPRRNSHGQAFSFFHQRARRRKLSAVTAFDGESTHESAQMDTASAMSAPMPETMVPRDIEANPIASVAGDDKKIDENGATSTYDNWVSHLGGVSCLWKNVRTRCYELSQHKRFDQCVLVMIVLCSATLVVSTPLQNPEGDTALIVIYCDWVFTAFFLWEMGVKIIGWGIWGYLCSWWNCLDGVIVLMGLLGLLLPHADIERGMSWVKVCRLVRALRPLRMINRNPNLKVVINTIFQSLPQLCNLFIVTFLFLLVFGLLGVALFSGSFYLCKDATFSTISLEANATPRTLCLDTYTGTLQVRDASSALCQENVATQQQYLPYVRPSTSTPLCVLHCDIVSDGVTAPMLCQKSPWEYEVARCVDCQRVLCPNVDLADIESCKADCWDSKRMFCVGLAGSDNDGVAEECHAECVAQCVCLACEALVQDAAHCVEQGYRWVPMEPNFDKIIPAIVSLFGIATTEGWVRTMYVGVDSRGPYNALERDTTKWYAFFFVAFIAFGSFCVLNLCVGVIIDNFSRLKGANGGMSMLMTQAQTRWVESQETFFSKSAYFTKLMSMNVGNFPRYRKWLFFSVMSSNWDRVIMIAICLNTVNMALPMHPAPYAWWMPLITHFNYGFALLFNAEVVCKIIALRDVYFIDPWNRFDFFCVQATNVGIAMTFIVEVNVGGGVLGIFRLFRMVRLFRLVRFFKSLTQLFAAFFLCLPKLVNVGGILALFLFVYAVVGTHLFAKTRAFEPIDDHANFRDCLHSMLTLIRAMTGEGWNDIMYMYGKEKWFFEAVLGLHCEETMTIATAEDYYAYDAKGEIDAPVECGSYALSLFFFISFTLTVAFIILNLFIAVIMDGFDESAKAGEKLSAIILSCLETWKRYDKEYCLKLSLEDAFSYINEVMQSLKCQGPQHSMVPFPSPPRHQSSQSLYDARVLQLRVTPDNMVHFNSVILSILRLALVGNSNDVLEQLEAFERGDVEKPKNFIRKEKKFIKAMHEAENILSWEEIMAAVCIQRRLKALISARKARQAEEQQAKTREDESEASVREARGFHGAQLLKRAASSISLGSMPPKCRNIPSKVYRKISNARENSIFGRIPSIAAIRNDSSIIDRDTSIVSIKSENSKFARMFRKREKSGFGQPSSMTSKKLPRVRDNLELSQVPSLVSKTTENSEIDHASSMESKPKENSEVDDPPSRISNNISHTSGSSDFSQPLSIIPKFTSRKSENSEFDHPAWIASKEVSKTRGNSEVDHSSSFASKQVSKTSDNSEVDHSSSMASKQVFKTSDNSKFVHAPSMVSEISKSSEKSTFGLGSSMIGGT